MTGDVMEGGGLPLELPASMCNNFLWYEGVAWRVACIFRTNSNLSVFMWRGDQAMEGGSWRCGRLYSLFSCRESACLMACRRCLGMSGLIINGVGVASAKF